jgi:hypothetical protein
MTFMLAACLGAPVAEAETRCAGPAGEHLPREGVVPTSTLAVKLAVLYLSEVYGAPAIEQQSPLRAILRGEIWLVEGTLPDRPGTKGGVAQIELCRANGRVLGMSHGK